MAPRPVTRGRTAHPGAYHPGAYRRGPHRPGAYRRRVSLGTCLAVAGVALGCVPRERVNASCAWREDAGALAPPGTGARRAHLVGDARLAQELGVRYADSAVGRPPPSMADWVDAERRCTNAALGAAVRRHAPDGGTRAELDALVGAREWWFDSLAVFLPATALFVLLSRRVAAGVVAANAPIDGSADRWVAAVALAALTPLAAGVALVVTGSWAGLAEMLRLRNDHISYRAFQLPTSRHPWLIAAVAAAVFAVTAAAALRRARLAARDAGRGAGGGGHRPPAGSVSLRLGARPHGRSEARRVERG